ncbi:GHMP kinase [Phyllobacterium phragmitis]|uniref:GHMP kinase n=1 Tax=Phyllobacterium phragmitis TaxID=2670329 RepID=A0A2S9ILR5_9HYPH|nr:beta-ribofuranosylaminobenzene 5'-phosphate synthase family protein [Phyllobacterium phragmitis]PRD41476.1 GHMP kinase [Phyllobacterium phragmitis]
MSDSVSIKVPARLHLGFLDMPKENGPRQDGGRFGSIGLPLEGIATELTISRSRETSVEGDERARVAQHLARLCAHLGIRTQHRIVVHRTIPRHAGLGSGTQIALAVAAALRTLHRLPLDSRNDAILLGRGARSGIGIAAFEKGGLIVDAGRFRQNQSPTVITHIPFPRDWRIILVLDETTQGIHGEAEIEAFRTLPSFPDASSAAICRQVLMGVMPALIEQDFPAFGRAVGAVQTEIGAYFSPAQGGAFTSKAVEAVLADLKSAGAVGIGQSSWGPTGFAFAPSQSEAERIVKAAGEPEQVSIRIVSGRNEGAEIIRSALDLVSL